MEDVETRLARLSDGALTRLLMRARRLSSLKGGLPSDPMRTAWSLVLVKCLIEEALRSEETEPVEL